MLASFYKENTIEAGCDEAGRGCLAGPVVAAAVILPKDFSNKLLNDSKLINEKNRNLLREVIEQNALSYAVAFVDNEKIDEINILKASIYAMHLALEKLHTQPKHIIIDGNKFYPYKEIPFKTIIKGDGKYASIAAASVLAKTYRDEYMKEQAEIYPNYGWLSNKGYPTKAHREAIAKHGACPLHRKSFKLLKDEQMELF